VRCPTGAEAPQLRAAVVPASEIKVPEKQAEKVDTHKAGAEERERKKHFDERKARNIAVARAKRQNEAKQQVEQQHAPQPGIMACHAAEISRSPSSFLIPEISALNESLPKAELNSSFTTICEPARY
jgi:hypothetical protein